MTTPDSTYEYKDIPTCIVESCAKYPKLQWAYNTTKLLDIQNIGWAMCATDAMQYSIDAFNYGDHIHADQDATVPGTVAKGKVFTQKLGGEELITEVAVVKGEIKWIKHFNPNDLNPLDHIVGDIELKVSALLHLHFRKYSGILSIQSIGKAIIGVDLFVRKELRDKIDKEQIKKIIKIYNNRGYI